MKIKLSDYVINWLIEKEIDTIFSVSGGFIGHLLDSVNKKRDKLNYVCARNESNAGFMAYGYGKLKNRPAVALITNGPATTNILTSVVSAYQDSTPMIIISGQVYTNQSVIGSDLRQLGVQELNILPLLETITKYPCSVKHPNDIKAFLDEAYIACMENRKGPVWIEIPLNIQSEIIETDELWSDLTFEAEHEIDCDISEIYNLIKSAERPLIIAGAGIKQSDCVWEFNLLREHKFDGIPCVSTWGANDLFNHEDPNYLGCFGVMGRREANLAIQSADLLLVLGSRLSLSNVGYNYQDFAPNAKKIMVDCDWAELNKKTLKIDYKICADLKEFINEMIKYEF